MSVLKNAYRSVFFLFLLAFAPSCIYSNNCPQSFGFVKTSTEIIENGVINQNILRENDLIDKSRRKMQKT